MAKVYENRELSWLKFNERVIEEAEDITVPPYERLKFISIFHNNLDEFYMVRVGSLCHKTLSKSDTTDKISGMTAKEQLSEIYKKTAKMMTRKDAAYQKVRTMLGLMGVTHTSLKNLEKYQQKGLEKRFLTQIKPSLSPLIIDDLHPFPFLENKQVYVGLQLLRGGQTHFAIIPVMPLKQRIVYISENPVKFVLMEELIEYYADLIFDNYKIVDKLIFRVTRNTDMDMNSAYYDADGDLRFSMSKLLTRRERLNPTRLEMSKADTFMEGWLIRQLYLSKKQVFVENSPLDMSFGFALEDKVDKKLMYSPLTPQRSPALNMKKPLFHQIQKKDVLLSYPFEDVNQFIALLDECAADEYVTSMKITLYRVASNSKVISALCKAAENGKEVIALVELRARFDEENNIAWAKRLEESGVKVIYGIPDFKVHSKLLLITRKQGKNYQYITQIGTGNYNEKTSKQYTDLSLMTANKEIAEDAATVFSCLINGTTVSEAKHLLVAPNLLKQGVIKMIDEQIAKGADGYIGLKMNSVCDKELIDKLIEASKAGVCVEMVIRGICSLVPEIEGETDNIKLVSIVGRFLEHSRIYVFGKGNDAKVYISSADFMTRNTDKRVEVAAPILDEKIKSRVIGILETCLSDTVKGRFGRKYTRRSLGELDSQEYFYSEAYKNAEKKNGFFGRIFGE